MPYGAGRIAVSGAVSLHAAAAGGVAASRGKTLSALAPVAASTVSIDSPRSPEKTCAIAGICCGALR
jgi:hypothetical protein